MACIEVEEGVHIYAEDLYPEGDKTVVFIHGWPVNHQMYEYQTTWLPNYGYRCVGIDLRGFGDSDRPWQGYCYDRLADDIRVIMDALCLENVTLVGHSMGGAISIRYMARHKGYQVGKLALLAAAAPSFVQRKNYPYGMTKRQVDELIYKTYTDRPAMMRDFGNIFFYQPVSDELRLWFWGLGMAASNHATAMTAMSLRDEDLRSDLAKIHVPTGIFHGKHDQVCPYEFALMMHQGIYGSQLFPFEQSGHGIFYEELALFQQRFLSFLET
ncbi:alpha/beta hydrolase [Brevibacillus sp. 7WMA2]|uniref:alpha/beta fold hydrolase n=1 Tax=Brevibacillus sp. 7WMA2 TaxID=2683193 RepID=UPI0013A7123C|nr:alpha/beta hydrolase [Brevibacillus sp. 7WMA2]QIC07627.1 alpha/beta hydrolase [Brevibacillus sp. 7WMA2]